MYSLIAIINIIPLTFILCHKCKYQNRRKGFVFWSVCLLMLFDALITMCYTFNLHTFGSLGKFVDNCSNIMFEGLKQTIIFPILFFMFKKSSKAFSIAWIHSIKMFLLMAFAINLFGEIFIILYYDDDTIKCTNVSSIILAFVCITEIIILYICVLKMKMYQKKQLY